MIRRCSIWLLAAIVLLTCVAATSTSYSVINCVNPSPNHQNNAPPRMLRTMESVDEERGLPGLSGLTEKAKSFAKKTTVYTKEKMDAAAATLRQKKLPKTTRKRLEKVSAVLREKKFKAKQFLKKIAIAAKKKLDEILKALRKKKTEGKAYMKTTSVGKKMDAQREKKLEKKLVEKAAVLEKNPQENMAVLGPLIPKYGDDIVAKALAATVKDPTKENKMLKAYLYDWLHTDDVLKALKNPKMDFVNKYITLFNEKFPDDKMDLLHVLRVRYGDDELQRAFGSAKAREDTTGMVQKLYTDLQLAWLKE